MAEPFEADIAWLLARTQGMASEADCEAFAELVAVIIAEAGKNAVSEEYARESAYTVLFGS